MSPATTTALSGLSLGSKLECYGVLCRTPAKRGPGFIALGDMALALADVGCADEMRVVAPRIAEQIREAISAQRGRKGVFCPEALQVQQPCMPFMRLVRSKTTWRSTA